jgi:DNA-binding response OmpR family regulator
MADERVLLLEPNTPTASVLRWLLRENGYVAESGTVDPENAVDEIAQRAPDVVIARASAIDVRRLVHGMRNAAIDARLIVAAPRPGGAARASPAHDDDGVDDWVGVPYNPREVLSRSPIWSATSDCVSSTRLWCPGTRPGSARSSPAPTGV